MNRSTAVPEPLMLAAIDRAGRHRDVDVVPAWDLYAHLGFARRSGNARAARRQLDALTAAGVLERSRRHSIDMWSLTRAGRRRLRAVLRTETPIELPESPQHATWRSARHLAEQEIERFSSEARTALMESLALVESGATLRSDVLLDAAERLRFVIRRLGCASYCLHEWEEPSDDHADIDRYENPGDAALTEDDLARVRWLRQGRRDTSSWTATDA